MLVIQTPRLRLAAMKLVSCSRQKLLELLLNLEARPREYSPEPLVVVTTDLPRVNSERIHILFILVYQYKDNIF